MTADELSTELRWPDRTEAAPQGDASSPDDDPPPPGVEPLVVEVIEPPEREWRHDGDPPPRPVQSGPVATAPGGRFMMEAYDRLADRVLDRLRSMREGVDEDLFILRSEIAALRTSVEDVADRVQLRKVRSELDQVRAEVAGLRADVLDRPDLEVIAERTQEVLTEVRAHDPSAVAARVAELVAEATAVREAGALDPVLAELATVHRELGSVREDLEALRRRIALRATPSAPGGLGEEQMARLAEEVATRVLAQLRQRQRRR
jgi:hypothetical protein